MHDLYNVIASVESSRDASGTLQLNWLVKHDTLVLIIVGHVLI